MRDIVRLLVRRVKDRWRGGTQDEFARIAAEELHAQQSARELAEADVLTALACMPLPPQLPAENERGRPSITVHRDEVVRVEVVQRDPLSFGAHQHGSAGAFAPIVGKRLVVRYDCGARAALGSGITWCDLAPSEIRLLDLGDAEPILPGPALTHDVFLLSPPGLTLTIRLQRRAPGPPALTFVGRGFAFQEPEDRLLGARRRLQTLLDLRAVRGPHAFEDALLTAAGVIDPREALFLLACLFDGTSGPRRAVAALAARLDVRLAVLEAELEDVARRRSVKDALRFFDAEEERIALAALWATRTPEELRELWETLGRKERGLPPLEELLDSIVGERSESPITLPPLLTPLASRIVAQANGSTGKLAAGMS